MPLLIGAILFILIASLISLINGALLWLLWNELVVNLFDGANHLGYWAAVAIMLLVNLLFGSRVRSS